MSKQSRSPKPGAQVIFFAEDEHDARAIRTLLAGLRGDILPGSMKIRKSPPSLVKDLEVAKRRTRASKVLATLRAIDANEGVRATVFHEDADALEPAHEQGIATIQATYEGAPGSVIACVPAWELESWWFLFPEAVGVISQSWRDPDQYLNKDVGQIEKAKERLSKCVQPPRKGKKVAREYEEADSIDIAKNIVARGIIASPRAKSKSWDAFVEQCQAI